MFRLARRLGFTQLEETMSFLTVTCTPPNKWRESCTHKMRRIVLSIRPERQIHAMMKIESPYLSRIYGYGTVYDDELDETIRGSSVRISYSLYAMNYESDRPMYVVTEYVVGTNIYNILDYGAFNTLTEVAKQMRELLKVIHDAGYSWCILPYDYTHVRDDGRFCLSVYDMGCLPLTPFDLKKDELALRYILFDVVSTYPQRTDPTFNMMTTEMDNVVGRSDEPYLEKDYEVLLEKLLGYYCSAVRKIVG